jgi:DNA gyrase subunit A
MAGKRGKTKRASESLFDLPMDAFEDASLAEETRRRYLTYALSVITSRALPDVRDGLKPVQRRILYTMQNELGLRSDARYRKSAAIVGDVMGKFHPHGDSSIYEALVRMAQSFTMRAPLVDGRGNFGSPDGDSAAAMRYTEAKLMPLADELLAELGKQTVAFRPNYDGTRFEPVVLPARFPNLLVNGSQGIAVGMATSIPPHNLGEVGKACIALIEKPELTTKQLMRYIKGPDFPTGGELISDRDEIAEVYETGQGGLKLRGEWKIEENDAKAGNTTVVITSIPYAVERRAVVEKVAEVIIKKKLPMLLDVRDESSEECRIVCEIKKGADPQLVMAYLYKNTPLQTNIQVNLTCLVPTEAADICSPQRLNLKSVIRYFLDFRMEVVTKRLGFDLNKLRERIHVLDALVSIYDALDETIRIIRRSEDRQDAAEKLMKRFDLDKVQVDYILELRLYRLAKLQILLIREELGKAQAEAARLEKLLSSELERWNLVRSELHELVDQSADARLTRIVTDLDEPHFEAEAFIVDEDAIVLLSHQGWVKRQQRVKDLSATRTREGDAVMAVAAGSTRQSVAFFSNLGSCYVTRIVDIPATTGYGNPIQTLFKMADGERVVAMLGFDPRFLDVPAQTEGASEPEPPFALAVSRGGMTLRFSLRHHRDPSTRTGRRYFRLAEGDEVLYLAPTHDGDKVACVTQKGHALICQAEEVPVLAGAGKGVMLIKVADKDHVVGAQILRQASDAFIAIKDKGTEYPITTRRYEPVARAGKGHALFKRGEITGVTIAEPTIPEFPNGD